MLANHALWLANEVKKATEEIRAREKEMVLRLSKAAEHRDPETGQHLLRMANYSRLVARELGLVEDEQNLIMEAAPMHDIGKVATPDAILLKQGRLTEEEFVIMKEHAAAGYNILRDSDSLLLRTAAILAWTHHEKFDGKGYPNGLKGDDIPLYGRIVAVADVFDALTSVRPYKKAWSLDDAVNFLKENSGAHFDPECVEAFLRAWDDVLVIHEKYQEPENENYVA
jgi:putative two-component system response regulator